MLKVCSKCKTAKSLKEFFRDSHKKSGYTSSCKVCRQKAHSGWKKRNKEKCNHTSRINNYKRMYGITIDDWNRMFQEQCGRCAICGKHQSEEPMRLHVDHNHTTGKVRKLLCSNCNRMLGCAKEDIRILDAAIKYLLDTCID